MLSQSQVSFPLFLLSNFHCSLVFCLLHLSVLLSELMINMIYMSRLTNPSPFRSLCSVSPLCFCFVHCLISLFPLFSFCPPLKCFCLAGLTAPKSLNACTFLSPPCSPPNLWLGRLNSKDTRPIVCLIRL